MDNNQTDPSLVNTSDISKELAHVTQEMYKKNKQLTETNRTLALLRKIDSIILSSVTELQQVAQQVANTIVDDTDFRALSILILDKKENNLQKLALSQTQYVNDAELTFNKSMQPIKTPMNQDKNLVVKAVLTRVKQSTLNLFDFVTPDFNEEESKKIQEIVGIVSSIAYPLIVRDEVIGAMVLHIAQKEEDLSEATKDLIDRLAGVIGIAIDNALLYQEIKDANIRLQELDKLKDEFVSFASHELRTPMTSIQGYVWMVLNEKDSAFSDKTKERLEKVLSSSQRLIALVNDILDVSRIESGAMVFNPTNFDIVALAKEVLEELADKAKTNNVVLTVDANASFSVTADRDKVHEVLLNLMDNAVKYSPNGGAAQVLFKDTTNAVEITVSDSGIGITKENLDKLFTKFGRIEGPMSSAYKTPGTGLGLYLSKKIVEKSGGQIWVESEIGKGSKFIFTIPKGEPSKA